MADFPAKGRHPTVSLTFFPLPLDNVPIIFHFFPMDRDHAINRHRKQLARIVATLFAMVGLVEGSPAERLS